MIARWFLVAVSVTSLIGSLVWGRSAIVRRRTVLKNDRASADAIKLTSGLIAHDLHTAGLYATIALTVGLVALTENIEGWYFLAALALPVMVSMWLARYVRRDARIADERQRLERRALEVLEQTDSAPARWAQRLAPTSVPEVPGYEIGIVHEALSGVMSGDFIDVFTLPCGRVCCVVGDVSGHDVEASITALQTKLVLRSYLRRFRDPGQAFEEFNRTVTDYERPEEFVSLIAVVFDFEAETMRYASAGHPAAWLSQQREPRPLRATGPLLMVDASASFGSREMAFTKDDVLLALSDGVAEARNGSQLFGEERIAATVRKFEDASPQQICHEVVNAAREFASGPLSDDLSILAVRKTK